MRCIETVVDLNCNDCQGSIIKFGKINGRQRYRCKSCNKTQVQQYLKSAYEPHVNNSIVLLLREGCGIRSIARLLSIATNTVLSRIRSIADKIKKPVMTIGRQYEVDELTTYIRNKNNDFWIIYALDKLNGKVSDFKVGRRTKQNIKLVIDTLLKSSCKRIFTDGLGLYKLVIPAPFHSTRRYGTNKIERRNLSLRTHLKRLHRKTICFSRSLVMLEACLKIYFWHDLDLKRALLI